jgi:iron complex transport system substrate-binding protein
MSNCSDDLRVTKRLAAVLVAVLVTVLSACGTSGGSAEPAGSTAPAAAKRVVSTDMTTTDVLLALGIVPVGSVVYKTVGPADDAYPSYLGEQTGQITSLGVQDPNVETVASLRPDLIVGFSRTADPLRDKLTAIAPVVTVDSATNDWAGWTRTIGEAVGDPAAADRVVAAYEKRVADLRPAVAGRSVAIARPRSDNVLVYGPESLSGRVLTDLGMTLVAPGVAAGKSTGTLSHEQVGSLAGDELVLFTFNLDRPAAELLAGPVWSSLPAVTAARTAVVEGSAWNAPGPLGIQEVLTEAEGGLVRT